MRTALARASKMKPIGFTGEFIQYGTGNRNESYNQPTVLIHDLRFSKKGGYICDHIWLLDTNFDFKELNLLNGDMVQFKGYVKSYTKGGGKHRKTDFTIRDFTNISKITKQAKSKDDIIAELKREIRQLKITIKILEGKQCYAHN